MPHRLGADSFMNVLNYQAMKFEFFRGHKKKFFDKWDRTGDPAEYYVLDSYEISGTLSPAKTIFMQF